MSSSRRLALLLALVLPAMYALRAQSSSSNPSVPGQDQAQQPAAAAQNPGQSSVQARIRARRQQRRLQAIKETYGHLYEAYVGTGYLRFRPGNTLQQVNEYPWNVGFTRYYSERLGVTLDGRGYYGKPFIRPQALNQNITKPTISQYSAMIGPTYRFYLQPKVAISGRVLAGFAYGNFSGDTSGNGQLAAQLGLYPNGSSFAVNPSIVGDYNLTPAISWRIATDYQVTDFGSTVQKKSVGFTSGIVVRFGKM